MYVVVLTCIPLSLDCCVQNGTYSRLPHQKMRLQQKTSTTCHDVGSFLFRSHSSGFFFFNKPPVKAQKHSQDAGEKCPLIQAPPPKKY